MSSSKMCVGMAHFQSLLGKDVLAEIGILHVLSFFSSITQIIPGSFEHFLRESWKFLQ